MKSKTTAFLTAATVLSVAATASEYPAGEPVTKHGLQFAAFHLRPVVMEPCRSLSASRADIHLEADIHAVEANPNRWTAGAWAPYLTVAYRLTKENGDTVEGVFSPMLGSDGPHCDANVALQKSATNHLEYAIQRPGSAPEMIDAPMFMCHLDDKTAGSNLVQAVYRCL